AYEPDLLFHALQEQFELLDPKRLRDVVIGPEAHRLYRALDRAVSCHDRYFGAWLRPLDLPQEVEAGHVRHTQIRKHQLGCFHPQMGERHLRTLGFCALQSDGISDRRTELADALVVINNQKAKAILMHHETFPNRLLSVASSCATRNGFSI